MPWGTAVKAWTATSVSVCLLYACIPSFGVLTSRLGAGDFPGLAKTSLFVSSLIFARAGCLYAQDVLGWRAALQAVDGLRQEAFVSLLALDAATLADRSSALAAKTRDLSHRLTFEAEKSALLVHALVQRLVPGLLQIAAMLCRMATLSPALTVATLLVAPLMGMLGAVLGEWVRRRSSSDVEASARLSSHVASVFTTFEFVVAYGAASYELGRFRDLSRSFLAKRERTEQVRALLPAAMTAVYTATIVLLFGASCWLIRQGRITGSVVVAFCTTLVFLMEPIQGVSAAFNEMKQSQASLDRLLELVELKGEHSTKERQRGERESTGEAGNGQGAAVEVEGISFAYNLEGGGRKVLDKCSLRIARGSKVGIMGLSGSGKSTLVKAILGLYAPDEGAVKVAGVDVSSVHREDLSRMVCLVPQEPPLIDGTVLENLKYGLQRQDVTREEVESVCKICEIHDDIMALENGYSSVISGYRNNLSGGQKQRVAIARALLRRPGLLILDEALAALDLRTARRVKRGVEQHVSSNGNTLIYVTHQLETVKDLDYVFILGGGKVLEEGPPGHLMENSGVFANFLEIAKKQIGVSPQ